MGIGIDMYNPTLEEFLAFSISRGVRLSQLRILLNYVNFLFNLPNFILTKYI